MKKIIMVLLVAVFALGMIACDEEDKCQKCVDDYCDCVEANPDDVNALTQCATDLASCANDHCDEGDQPDTSECENGGGDGGA